MSLIPTSVQCVKVVDVLCFLRYISRHFEVRIRNLSSFDWTLSMSLSMPAPSFPTPMPAPTSMSDAFEPVRSPQPSRIPSGYLLRQTLAPQVLQKEELVGAECLAHKFQYDPRVMRLAVTDDGHPTHHYRGEESLLCRFLTEDDLNALYLVGL